MGRPLLQPLACCAFGRDHFCLDAKLSRFHLQHARTAVGALLYPGDTHTLPGVTQAFSDARCKAPSRRPAQTRVHAAPHSSESGVTAGLAVSRRDLALGAVLLAGAATTPPALASTSGTQVGSYLPAADDVGSDFVRFVPDKTKTPAIRAGTVDKKQPYSFALPSTWTERKVANIASGNYCQPRCAEPWTEVIFADDAEGKASVRTARQRREAPAMPCPAHPVDFRVGPTPVAREECHPSSPGAMSACREVAHDLTTIPCAWTSHNQRLRPRGRAQVLAAPLVRLTNKKNVKIEEVGTPETFLQSIGPFITGTYLDPEDVQSMSSEAAGDGLTYYYYDVYAPSGLNGPHLLTAATVKGDLALLFIVAAGATLPRWPSLWPLPCSPRVGRHSGPRPVPRRLEILSLSVTRSRLRRARTARRPLMLRGCLGQALAARSQARLPRRSASSSVWYMAHLRDACR